MARPKYYAELREYVKKKFDAEMVEGREADDAIGCAQWAAKDKSTIICSIDKDLRMIPGYHYNFVKGEFDYITLSQANRNFWMQVLIGDRTDNILGIDGVGPKKAAKILEKVGDGYSYRDVVEEAYWERYLEEAIPRMNEAMNLLWIQRKEGELCPYL